MLVLGCFAQLAFAQNERRQEKIEAFKKQYYNEKLAFTNSEKESFWPLYTQYEKNKEALKRQYKKKGAVPALLPDDELEEFIFAHLEMEQKQLDLKKDLIRELIAVLPIRKVASLTKVEREFKQQLLKRMQEMRQNNRQNKRSGF